MRKILFTMAVLLILIPALTRGDDYFNYGKYTPADIYPFCIGVTGWVEDYGIRNVWGDEDQYVYYLDSYGWAHKYKVWLTNEGSAADPTPYINPHQHPDNPDAIGPIEPRHFQFVSNYYVAGDVGTTGITSHSNEIHVDDSGIYIGAYPYGIHKWNHDWTYAGQIAPAPPLRTETLAFNPDDNLWYAGERYRMVYQLSDTDIDGSFMDETWVVIFTYPNYGGDHHDGLEYAGGFLWISDMTSDMIGKWENIGGVWTEIGTYTYSEVGYVEGMGFGPNDHFWIGAGWNQYDYFYEIGGGKLIVEIPVYVDIKPGSCPNPLNVNKRGVLSVAILGTEDFDVTTIDPASVQLEGVSPLRWAYEDTATPFEGELCECHDLEGDGYLDLNLKFDAQEVVAALGLVNDGDVLTLTLTGSLEEEFESTPIRGQDCVVIRLKQ